MDVFWANLAESGCHGPHYGNFKPSAQLYPHSLLSYFKCGNCRAEQDWAIWMDQKMGRTSSSTAAVAGRGSLLGR